jgi:hypothetical protein
MTHTSLYLVLTCCMVGSCALFWSRRGPLAAAVWAMICLVAFCAVVH